MKLLEKIKLFVVINVIWRVFPSKKHEIMRVFEATEDDSAWQLLNGIKMTHNPEAKAELFLQALEESHHAELFRELCKKEFNTGFQKYFHEKKALYKLDEDSWKLPVYCLIGEKSAADRFQNIVDVSPNNLLKKTLKKIVADEIGHIHKAQEQIEVDNKSQDEVNAEVKKIIRKRFLESWMRSGRKITNFLINILLFIIYVSIGPVFAAYLALKKLKLKGNHLGASIDRNLTQRKV